MRILLDECCPPALADALRKSGHDVVHALVGGRGGSDYSHAVTAVEDQRVVVTADYDFGDLALRDEVSFLGLVILAPDLGDISRGAQMIAERISTIEADAIGCVSIVSSKRTRHRRLSLVP